MSVGFLVVVFAPIVDTVPLPWLATKTVLPSGVTASPNGDEPTVMSVGFFVLALTSIVDTVPLRALKTVPLQHQRARQPQHQSPSTPSEPRHWGVWSWSSRRSSTPRVLGPGLHIDRRHRAAAEVGDEGRLAVRRERHHARERPDGGEVLRPAEVAEFFEVTTRTIRRWGNSGLLPSFRTVGGQRRFRWEDVRRAASPNPLRS